MPKIKPIFNTKEQAIIKLLHSQGGFLTANEISERTGISYITVLKYLAKLYKEGIIEKEGDEDGNEENTNIQSKADAKAENSGTKAETNKSKTKR